MARQREGLTAQRLALGHALPHVEVHQFGVDRHRPLHDVVQVERLPRGAPREVVQEESLATERTHHHLLGAKVGGEGGASPANAVNLVVGPMGVERLPCPSGAASPLPELGLGAPEGRFVAPSHLNLRGRPFYTASEVGIAQQVLAESHHAVGAVV